jgi:hypothetical protein
MMLRRETPTQIGKTLTAGGESDFAQFGDWPTR